MRKPGWIALWSLLATLSSTLAGRSAWAQGTWVWIPLPPPRDPGALSGVTSLATDRAGNLYVAMPGQIVKRDTQGNWEIIATTGEHVGQVIYPQGLAIDSAGNLYVTDELAFPARIQRRDLQGNWTVLDTEPGQGIAPAGMAIDTLGNLYTIDRSTFVIRKRDPQGNWTIIATKGSEPGKVSMPGGLAADIAGNLYVADAGNNRIQRRDPQGKWTVLTTNRSLGPMSDPMDVSRPFGVATDTMGNLYVADTGHSRIQKRDAQGIWTILRPHFDDDPYAVASDSTTGRLYVAVGGQYPLRLYIPGTPILSSEYGDLDSDGRVTLADATLCLNMAVGNHPSAIPADLLKRADVAPRHTDGTFGDGVVTIADCTRILRRAVGLETTPWP